VSVLALLIGILLGVGWASSRPKGEDANVLTKVVLSMAPGPQPRAQDQALLDLIAAGREVNGSALYNFGIYNFYSALWREHGKGAREPSILEIGPGANLGQGMLFVATGARKYTGLDLYKDPELQNRYSYLAAYELLALAKPGKIRLKAAEIFTVKGEEVVFNPGRMQYLSPRQSYDIGLPDGSIDYVYSHSVFEHISDPDRTNVAIFKVLRKGGVSAHHFDMRDHSDFSRPLEFLKVDEPAWKARFTEANAYLYTNRRRLSDFVRSIEAAGFKLVRVERKERVPMSEEIRRTLHSDFQKYSLEDLAVVSALIVAEKP
jgi:SAM-dependent methyltransferase